MTSAPAAAFEGTWQLVRAELAGEAMPGELADRTELELRGGRYVVRFDGVEADRGDYAPGDPPDARLTLRGTAGTNLGRTIPCLYQLVGNRLRICYGLDETPPAAFATAAGDRRYLATYRRLV